MTLVLLVAGLLLFAFVRSVRSRALRDGLFLLTGIVAGLSVGTLPYIFLSRQDDQRSRAIQNATSNLTAPRTIGGIEFPAGSTVYADPDGTVRWGNVPQATIIDGVPIVGEFRLGSLNSFDPPGGISTSTLAVGTEIRGVPCAPGFFSLQKEGLRCTLARDYDYLGHLLKAGEVFDVGRPLPDSPITLQLGTLAQTERLDDADWPAGTIVGGLADPPDQLRHGGLAGRNPIQLCLQPGVEVIAKGAKLHGPIVYVMSGNARWFDLTCRPLTTFNKAAPRYSDGYAEIGDQHVQEGTWSSEKGWYKVR